jgi:hypothetical protein
MPQTFEDNIREGKLITLSELGPCVLTRQMDIPHPAAMGCSNIVGDMFLEDNYVGVWKLFGICRREDWSCIVMNRINEDR